MWPEIVHSAEIQSRLLHAGCPVERAMRIASEVAPLQHGARYEIALGDASVVLYAQGLGWFRTASE